MSNERMLRRTILLAFKSETSPTEIATVEQAFRVLPTAVAAIADLEWGDAVSSGGEYSHCLLISFRTAEDLEDYNNHPAHQAIATTYGHLVQQDLVFDYWMSRTSKN